MKKRLIVIGLIILVVLIITISVIVWFLYFKKDNVQDSQQDITVEETITSFDSQKIKESFAQLDYYILQPSLHKQAASEAVKYIQDPDDNKRFAAIYLLTLTGNEDNSSDLAKVLEDEDQAYATIAAGTLIDWGNKNAIPILIESLTSDKTIPYSDPPTLIGSLAYKGLSFYTDNDFGLSTAKTEEEINNAQAEWKMWWSSNNKNIEWDNENKKYIIK